MLRTERVVKTEAEVAGSWAITTRVVTLSALNFADAIACTPTLTVAIWQPPWLHSAVTDSTCMDPWQSALTRGEAASLVEMQHAGA